MSFVSRCMRNKALIVSKCNNSLRFQCNSHRFAVKDKPINSPIISAHLRPNNQSFSYHKYMKCSQSQRFMSNVTQKSSQTDDNSASDDSKQPATEEEDESVSRELKRSTESKFRKYSDDDSQVIYDVSEELDEEIYLYQQKPKNFEAKLEAMDTERGVNGVFDIHQLVDLLRSENLRDIAVIEVPEELNYCQHLVLVTAKSQRQINAFMEYFNKVYKMKKHRKDPFLDIGGNDAIDWKVVDMKNIVLHVFLAKTREYYDIETLWTVGYEFDDKIQRPEADTTIDIMEKHMKYLETIKPLKNY
ncbi:unnamed protein product [Oppiella nova]|uniref:Mitochondrial assembly of ribosomal large subunit protein 1 n=1 Tax=Oppiella nova TaxID=334625 RepID=A0A7R9LJU6_9ACAR|nr:unnamed protein product [Oppiella nova]CAG2164343.1 unnamed protein product [Oppiella nova]